MLARLGEVIYWAASTFAALVLLYFLAGSLVSTAADLSARLWSAGLGAAIALICWLVGWTARTIFSGKRGLCGK